MKRWLRQIWLQKLIPRPYYTLSFLTPHFLLGYPKLIGYSTLTCWYNDGTLSEEKREIQKMKVLQVWINENEDDRGSPTFPPPPVPKCCCLWNYWVSLSLSLYPGSCLEVVHVMNCSAYWGALGQATELSFALNISVSVRKRRAEYASKLLYERMLLVVPRH